MWKALAASGRNTKLGEGQNGRTVAVEAGSGHRRKVEYRLNAGRPDETQVFVEATQKDDGELMALIAAGQEAALGELYDRYSRLVMSVAFGVVGNRQTAEEVTLDAFTRVWQHADKYDPAKAQVSTWLTRLARNRAIDVLRREEARPLKHSVAWADLHLEPSSDGHSPEGHAHVNLQTQRVLAAMGDLTSDQQQVLALAYFKGYSHRQIAQLLDQPLGTVKGRIRAGMQKLRDALLEQETGRKRTKSSGSGKPE